jgi:adenylylsulfate kinase-like enzyme
MSDAVAVSSLVCRLSYCTGSAKHDDDSRSHEKYIFWLNGMAGTGKSTIARKLKLVSSSQEEMEI